MSIFKSTFPEGVRNQIKARQEKMLERDLTTIKYLNSRTAWIRMTSAVNVNGSDDLAKKNVLLGGALYNNAPRVGVGTTGVEAYSTKTLSGTTHRLGMKPMPGITGIEIKNKGAYGSLREVTINFNCWDIKQLEELELLYMRPNYSVLVEWGWLPYLTNDKKIGNTAKLTNDVLTGGKTKEEIWKTIITKASEDGNYDAIYGFIQNYSWKARSDGGYDCTTILITMGEILESLKVNYGAYDANILKSGGKGLFNILDPTKFEKETSINKSYSQNKLAGMLNEIWEIAVYSKDTSNLTSTSFELDGTTYDFFRYDLTVSGRSGETIKDSFVEEDQQIYITLEGFINLMNKKILLEDTAAKNPLVGLSVKEGAHNGGKEGDPLLCLGNKFQLSTDPTICLIKNPAWTNPLTNLGINTGDTDVETIKEIMNNLSKSYFLNDDWKEKQFGIIGNIYVNLGYLYSLIISDDLSSQDSKEKKDINCYDYIKNILSGINSAIGNVATLDILVDPTDSIGRIIDLNYVDVQSRQEVYDNAFPLQIHNLSSTVRSYSLESQIFPDQSTTIAIGAQVEGGALGSDSNTMIEFNKGLIDRIIPKKKAPGTTESDDLTSKIESLKTSLDVILSYINKTDPSWYEHSGDFDISDSSKYANALKDIIQFYKSIIKDNNKNRNIIPTKLSLEMDGIGGIIIGNIFKINEDILPQGYKGLNGVGSKIAYVVNEVGGSVNSNNDWVTKLGAQFIILDEPEGENSSKWDEIKNTIIKTVTTTQDTKQAATEVKKIIASNPTPPGNGNWKTLNTLIKTISPQAQAGQWKEARSNPNIINAYKEVGAPQSSDSVPWCAAFTGYVLKTSGLSYLKGNLSALSFSSYGTDVPISDRNKWRQWDIVVFKSSKPGQGHVGFLYGASADGKKITVLGGNQGDNVKLSTFNADSASLRLYAIRRGNWTDAPSTLPLNTNDQLATTR